MQDRPRRRRSPPTAYRGPPPPTGEEKRGDASGAVAGFAGVEVDAEAVLAAAFQVADDDADLGVVVDGVGPVLDVGERGGLEAGLVEDAGAVAGIMVGVD